MSDHDDPVSSGPGDPQGFLDYTSTADKLVEIIEALIPEHPEILTMDSAFALFKVEGFKEAIKGLDPSLAQAQWALSTMRPTYE